MSKLLEAYTADAASAYAREEAALRHLVQDTAKELGATVKENENEYYIEGALKGWFRYLCSKGLVNLNTAKVYSIATCPFGETEVEMYVGGDGLDDIMKWRAWRQEEDEEMDIMEWTVDEVLNSDTYCALHISKKDGRDCLQNPLKWFWLERPHQFAVLMSTSDLWHEHYLHEKEEKEGKESAEVDAKVDDDALPF